MSVEARRRGYQPRVDSFDDVFEVFDDVFDDAARDVSVPSRRRPAPSQRGARDPKPPRAPREPRVFRQQPATPERGVPRQPRVSRPAREHRPAAARPSTPTATRSRRRTALATPALPMPKAAFVVAVVGLVVAGLVGVLVLRTKINENSLRLGDLRQTQQALSLQEQQLEQQIADLSAPGNLLEAAQRLGLVDAGTPAYLSLPDGRVVGVPQPAGLTVTSDPEPTATSTVDDSEGR